MRKTRKIMLGITTTAVTLGLAGCGEPEMESTALPPEPTDQSCRDWDWDDEAEVYICDDNNSPNYGYYFLAGKYYQNRSSLYKSSAYNSYKGNSSVKSGSNKSSGFGSGSSVSGG